jgi:hypothetical protein
MSDYSQLELDALSYLVKAEIKVISKEGKNQDCQIGLCRRSASYVAGGVKMCTHNRIGLLSLISNTQAKPKGSN